MSKQPMPDGLSLVYTVLFLVGAWVLACIVDEFADDVLAWWRNRK